MTEQELQRLRRDVSYAALPAKAGLSMAACFGFLVLILAVGFGLSIACDVMQGCYVAHPPDACLDRPDRTTTGGR